jgi:hypothetical protein
VVGTFLWINERAGIATLTAAGALSGAVVDADLDHHGMGVAGHGGIAECCIGLDHGLQGIVRGIHGINVVSEELGTMQKTPCVCINDEERHVAGVEQNGVGAFAANLWELS